MLFAGVMSGTSCDGIDVALVDLAQGIKLIATDYQPYPEHIKKQLLAVITNQPVAIAALSQLDAELGHLYASAINKLLLTSEIKADAITAIGLHGQTVFHQVKIDSKDRHANTIQLGSAAITAQQTGILTVANFRQMDLAHGGQGAPLAPVLHRQMFYQPGKQTVVLNLGGIANITLLNDDGVIGFDTGPASCLMDEYIQAQQTLTYDKSGQWAAQGEVNPSLLQALLTENYFSEPYPKSTGRELFNSQWLKKFLSRYTIEPVDIQRTLLQLTVDSIAMGIAQTKHKIDEVVVCGGGVHNLLLMNELSNKLDCPVRSSEQYKINPDFVEAVLMAWLAQQNIEQNLLDLRSITGVKTPLIYGVQHQPV